MSNTKTSKQKQQNIYEGAFDYNSPRPPVPGEEKTSYGMDWGQMERNRYKATSPTPKKHPNGCILIKKNPHFIFQTLIFDLISLF